MSKQLSGPEQSHPSKKRKRKKRKKGGGEKEENIKLGERETGCQPSKLSKLSFLPGDQTEYYYKISNSILICQLLLDKDVKAH